VAVAASVELRLVFTPSQEWLLAEMVAAAAMVEMSMSHCKGMALVRQ
jgi:hypothetical protein